MNTGQPPGQVLDREPGTAPENSEAAPSLQYPADALLLIQVRNMVLFPGMIMPIIIGRENTIAAAQEAIRGNRKVGVLLQRDPKADIPSYDELYHIGTVASILRY
jgi:ATP-dependent Lon protease